MKLTNQVYEDYRDARKAIQEMNGQRFEGNRIVVEPAGEKSRRKSPQPDDKCFNCGEKGHW